MGEINPPKSFASRIARGDGIRPFWRWMEPLNLRLALGRSPADPWAHFHWAFGTRLGPIYSHPWLLFLLCFIHLFSIPSTELHSPPPHFSFILVANCAIKEDSIEGNSADGSCSFPPPFFSSISLSIPLFIFDSSNQKQVFGQASIPNEFCWLLSLFSPLFPPTLFPRPHCGLLDRWLAHLLLFAGQWTPKNSPFTKHDP